MKTIAEQPIEELLFKIADDALILGHRNSEWTGIGPMLEEDIAFASMAQDKVGQSRQLYMLLHQMGFAEPDALAFLRPVHLYRCAQFVELPIGEYEFSLVRHWLFDTADFLRYQNLTTSSYEPLAVLARKFVGEIRYHILHAKMLIKRLGNSTPEAQYRLQTALDYALPFALGIFERSDMEQQIIEAGLFGGEAALETLWWEQICQIAFEANLSHLPKTELIPVYGGRQGIHTDFFVSLTDEMSEVIKLDPQAEW